MPAVVNQLSDAHDLDAMGPAEDLEIRSASHSAVLIHDLADYAGGIEAREPRQIHRRLSLTGTLEDATLGRTQGEHVAWPRKVVRTRGRIQDSFHRSSSIVSR